MMASSGMPTNIPTRYLPVLTILPQHPALPLMTTLAEPLHSPRGRQVPKGGLDLFRTLPRELLRVSENGLDRQRRRAAISG